ncbi:uncharacterized protein VTP21DRAFT_1906 [Calcarisporiella thermophila]|uniref:uncharacterized protein n=1 Tax=Calcarisporiella thermophila TaxID=911321 RepID=UPI00374230A4
MFKEFIDPLKRMNKRQMAMQVLNFLSVFCSAIMVYKGLSLVTNSESPVVVVLSESMAPAIHRGDLLFLNNPPTPIEIGEICVFKLPGRDVPIVHRVIKLHNEVETGKQYILTKGDNNPGDDRGLYNPGMTWIHKDHIVGRVRGFLPFVGMVTIWLHDYPYFKYIFLGVPALLVLFQRE